MLGVWGGLWRGRGWCEGASGEEGLMGGVERSQSGAGGVGRGRGGKVVEN